MYVTVTAYGGNNAPSNNLHSNIITLAR